MLIIGHRGASGYRPEHTESAYRLAIAQGADALEPDIVATSDGELVIRHENNIASTTDIASFPEFHERKTTKMVDGLPQTGWFTEDFTWQELQQLRCRERLPKLRPDNCEWDGQDRLLNLRDLCRIVDDAQGRSPQRVQLVIEVKHAAYYRARGIDLCARILEDLEIAGWADHPERVIFESFEFGALLRLRELGSASPLVMLTERLGAPADEPVAGERFRRFAWYRSNAGLRFLAQHVQGISVAKQSLLHRGSHSRPPSLTSLGNRVREMGLDLYAWTLRPENRFLNPYFRSQGGPGEWGDWQGEFELLERTGLQGLFVDHPDLGVAARGSAESTPSQLPRTHR